MDQRKPLVLFGFSVVAVAAILHAYQLVVEFQIMKQAHPFEADLFPARLQLYLIVAFLLTAAGLAIGKRAGLLVSALGILCVFVSHVR